MLNPIPLLLAAAAATNGPTLRIEDAVLMALENNRSLHVQRYEPALARTEEAVERAAFDPRLDAEAGVTREAGRDGREETAASLALTRRLPAGTELEAEVALDRLQHREPGPAAAEAAVTLTQPLLRGGSRPANLASLRQAQLGAAVSEYELRAFAESLVAEVETAYWACVLARRRLVIVEDALRVADRQLQEIDHRIRVGDLPETERASAQAESALRREALINARSALALATLHLRRLIQPAVLPNPGPDPEPVSAPALPEEHDPVAQHVETALRLRSDLNQARLQIEQGDLELVKTRNGLLPRLDLFVRLGDTGYARSFGKAAGELDGRDPELTAGVAFSLPLSNREARARHERAGLERDQAQAALANMEDLARVDVESACLEIDRAREQVAATAVTRRFQEEKLRAEEAKYRVGRSTSLLVAQAQQDLVNSQVAEVNAAIAALQAYVRLYRMEGTLLERRSLAVNPDPPAAR